MKEDQLIKFLNLLQQLVVLTLLMVMVVTGLLIIWVNDPTLAFLNTTDHKPALEKVVSETTSINNEIADGIHVATGFKADEGMDKVITHCTACHSSKLVIQNRATREGWEQMIIWMQQTQKLWDLGRDKDVVLDYLARNYAPEKQGRRQNLSEIEWYRLATETNN